MVANRTQLENFLKETSEEEIRFKRIFKDYYTRLVYFSYQIVKDKATAEDIAQEAFVKYWNQKEEVLSNSIAIKNFLYSTVKNASLNIIRHNQVVEKYHAILNCSETEIQDAGIVRAMIHAEVLAEIHQAIESLPESCQKISRMGYLQGMKNHEIATELGISINTVKTQKQRAIQLLRLKIRPDAFGLMVLLLLND